MKDIFDIAPLVLISSVTIVLSGVKFPAMIYRFDVPVGATAVSIILYAVPPVVPVRFIGVVQLDPLFLEIVIYPDIHKPTAINID